MSQLVERVSVSVRMRVCARRDAPLLLRTSPLDDVALEARLRAQDVPVNGRGEEITSTSEVRLLKHTFGRFKGEKLTFISV